MSLYKFDSTGRALSNRAIGERIALKKAAASRHLFAVSLQGPFFEKGLTVLHVSPTGVQRTLVPGEDYHLALMYMAASRKLNQPVYGAISLVDITTEGELVLSSQQLGGPVGLSTGLRDRLMTTNLGDPRFVTWESAYSDLGLSLPDLPAVDFAWSSLQVDEVKRAVEGLREAGLAVHLRASLLNNPQEAKFIPTAEEIGLGELPNWPAATEQKMLEGDDKSLVSPALLKQSLPEMLREQLDQLGYLIPVPFKAGLNIASLNMLVQKGASIYAPRRDQALPFVTNGVFYPEQWVLIRSTDRMHWETIRISVTGQEPTLPTGALVFNLGLSLPSEVKTQAILNDFIEMQYKIDYHLDESTLMVEYPLKQGDSIELHFLSLGARMPADRPVYRVMEINNGDRIFDLPNLGYREVEDLRVSLNTVVILSLKAGDYRLTEDRRLEITYPLRLGDVIEVEDKDHLPEVGKMRSRTDALTSYMKT